MLGSKMLKTLIPDHQTINMVVNKQWQFASTLF